MNRTRIIAAAAAGALTVALAAAAALPSAGTHSPRANGVVRLSAASTTGVVTYDDQGVTVAPPVVTTTPVAPSAASADTVMASFRAQDVPKGVLAGQFDSASHTVARQQVTETLPVSAEVTPGVAYPAWVVTYTGLSPVSYAPAAPPAGVTCTFVGVMNVSTGHWTEFFSSCA